MAEKLIVVPTVGASSNPLGIIFGATATIEFIYTPEKILNKDVSGVQLTMVDSVGAYVTKGPFNALIPWSNMISFVY